MFEAWVLAAALSAISGDPKTQLNLSPANSPAGPAMASAPLAISGQATAAAVVGDVRLPADTLVSIELADAVNSKDRVRGDTFTIRLAQPIVVDGKVLAPAGTLGRGQVVYAERGGGGGSPGKLVLAARYLDVGSTRVPLKAFNLAAGGESDFTEMRVAAELIGPGVFLINGHNVLYPAGTRARAKVSEDVLLPVVATLSPPANPPPTAAVAPAAPSSSTPVAPMNTLPLETPK